MDAGDVIKIEGPPTDADKAREILEEQAKELMTKMDFTEINVDAKYHKHIIGKGGSTVNKLKQETEVMINIPDSDKAPSNVIRIEGNKDGVKKAKEVSNRILNFRGKKNPTECLDRVLVSGGLKILRGKSVHLRHVPIGTFY